MSDYRQSQQDIYNAYSSTPNRNAGGLLNLYNISKMGTNLDNKTQQAKVGKAVADSFFVTNSMGELEFMPNKFKETSEGFQKIFPQERLFKMATAKDIGDGNFYSGFKNQVLGIGDRQAFNELASLGRNYKSYGLATPVRSNNTPITASTSNFMQYAKPALLGAGAIAYGVNKQGSFLNKWLGGKGL